MKITSFTSCRDGRALRRASTRDTAVKNPARSHRGSSRNRFRETAAPIIDALHSAALPARRWDGSQVLLPRSCHWAYVRTPASRGTGHRALAPLSVAVLRPARRRPWWVYLGRSAASGGSRGSHQGATAGVEVTWRCYSACHGSWARASAVCVRSAHAFRNGNGKSTLNYIAGCDGTGRHVTRSPPLLYPPDGTSRKRRRGELRASRTRG